LVRCPHDTRDLMHWLIAQFQPIAPTWLPLES
jgi:hypothetical protein